MRTLRFDSVGGASGDMILAALIDCGVSPHTLNDALAGLPFETCRIDAEPVHAGGLNGTRVTVTVPDNPHPHRHLADVRRIIEAGALPPTVAANALAIFRRLAQAEARVHGTTPEQIHFHEVGAHDAIVDIVGACLARQLLDVQAVLVGPLPCGRGTVRTAHGMLPVPVPATLELLGDHPAVATEEDAELVTPTGAAILMTWQQAPPGGAARTVAHGHGFGHRTLRGRPNLLRATVLERGEADAAPRDCLVLECNLDDTLPEWIGALTGKLLETGALDVFTSPVQMKKQRPGTLLTVLCRPEDRDRLLDLLFTETTTFGVREHVTRRCCLERRTETVQTHYGPVRVKIGTWKGRDVTTSPEHDDCARAATRHNVAVREVYAAAMAAAT
jgi:uncharacterized protein (TIGR00299 family) protein